MLIDTNHTKQLDSFCFEGFLYGKSYEEAHAYVRHGIENGERQFINQLNGTFCGYCYNNETGQLIVFNDRLGMQDLFLYNHHGRIIIASDYWELASLIGVDAIDYTAFGEMIRMQAPLFTKTFHQHIQLCPGASLIEVNIPAVKITKQERYWRLQAKANHRSEAQLLEEFIAISKTAVNESFNELDKSYCIANSGGLDSRCNLWLAAQTHHPFDTYTYGDEKSDAYHIARKTEKALNLNQQYFAIDQDFLNRYAAVQLQKSPMLPINYCWYHSAYQHLTAYDINVTGFGNFFEAFTHLDSKGRYQQLDRTNRQDIYRYNYQIHSVCSDELFTKLFRNHKNAGDYGAYEEQMQTLVNEEAYDILDEFEFEHRQRRITKNEPWMDYFGNMSGRHPMVHNDMVEFSLRLAFEHRHNKRLIMALARDYMKSVAKIRLDRLPWGPKEPQGIERKLRQFIWSLDHKLYKKTQMSLWFKGSHKHVKDWMLNESNYAFIYKKLHTSNELFDAHFNTEFIANNIQLLVKTNFLAFGSILTIKLYLDKILNKT